VLAAGLLGGDVAAADLATLAVIDMAERKLVKMIAGVGEQPWDVSSVAALSYCR
jgi:hypothetical protein